MGDYADFSDLNESTEQPVPIQNGGPKHKDGGLDNPAFTLTGPFILTPSGNMDNNFMYDPTGRHNDPNHLIFDTSTRGKKSLEAYSTSRKNGTLGYNTTLGHSTKSYLAHDLRKSQTLGRSTSPIAFMKAPHFATFQRRPYTAADAAHTYRRHHGDKKDARVAYFDIETENVPSYIYRPGEEISGAINIIVRQSLELRYVELVVTGQGVVTVTTSRDGFPHRVRETYLHKQKCVIGSDDNAWSSVLTPGHYTSKFRVKLPSGLPSTTHYEDAMNGFGLDVTYTLKARMCDEVTMTSSRSSHRYNKVRPFLERQYHFNVQRSFDLSNIPEAMSPVVHSEQIQLSCTHPEAAIVSVSLDRGVFLAGDDIRLQLQIALPGSQRVKDITCSLQEEVRVDSKHEPMEFTLSKMIRKDPYSVSGKGRRNNEEVNTFDVTIPTQTELISSYSLGTSQLKVEYFLAIILRFSPAGGKLSFKVPVGLGPCAEPIYAEKISSRKAVPFFHRTTRFPCFSTRSLPADAASRPSTPHSTSSVVVKTKYSNSCFAQCFLCCLGAAD